MLLLMQRKLLLKRKLLQRKLLLKRKLLQKKLLLKRKLLTLLHLLQSNSLLANTEKSRIERCGFFCACCSSIVGVAVRIFRNSSNLLKGVS